MTMSQMQAGLPEGWTLEDGYPYTGWYLMHECPDEEQQEIAEVDEVTLGILFKPHAEPMMDWDGSLIADCETELIVDHRCQGCGAHFIGNDWQGFADDDFFDWLKSWQAKVYEKKEWY